MSKLEHILIAYGSNIAYQNGAKYQILKNWSKWYSRKDISVCVLTDRPELFDGYPIRILELTPEMKTKWSLNGLQHFGIKLRGIHHVMATSACNIGILLDTDAYWTQDPCNLLQKINKNTIVMHSDEGRVSKSRNLSIRRFEEGLLGKVLDLKNKSKYQLAPNSRMLNSRVLGISQDNLELLEFAYDLFTNIEPLVDAHTVEQYSVSEAARINGFTVQFAKGSVADWSSTGRKNYVSPIINEFFFGTNNRKFNELVNEAEKLNIKRTLKVLVNQKVNHKLFRN